MDYRHHHIPGHSSASQTPKGPKSDKASTITPFIEKQSPRPKTEAWIAKWITFKGLSTRLRRIDRYLDLDRPWHALCIRDSRNKLHIQLHRQIDKNTTTRLERLAEPHFIITPIQHKDSHYRNGESKNRPCSGDKTELLFLSR